MDNKELQVENGNFTRIINPVLDEIVKIPFKGCELAVAIFIIRKTWGYKKTEDEISLTQFQRGTERSRQTVVSALKNLQLVNMVRLVKRGSTKNDANIWSFNKYIETWKLVNMVRLVKRNAKPSLMKHSNLVKTVRHTKDNTKDNTKDILSAEADLPFSFKDKVSEMFKSADRRMPIIAYYWTIKGINLENKDQYSSALKRELRAAAELKGYSNDRIKEVCEWLKSNADFKWTLESVHKFIDDDLKVIEKGKLTDDDIINNILKK